MATRKAVELIETHDTCAICETTPRYRVMLHGVQVDELHFNMGAMLAISHCRTDESSACQRAA
jgi:flagellar biosynthesis component FlhA